MSTNIQVLQTSVLLKYQPLFAFLQRHAPPVALEVQRAYCGAARTYYETGFRRYARTMTQVLARFPEKADLIAHATTPLVQDGKASTLVDVERLSTASFDGPPVTLAYQADDKNFRQHVEALFRSLHLVLLDNSTSEYSFVQAFFATTPLPPAPSSSSSFFSLPSPSIHDPSPLSPRGPFSPLEETLSDIGGLTPTARRFSINDLAEKSKEEKTALDAIWKAVLDPAVEYCHAFVRAALAGPPPAVSLVSMIRLNEAVLAEAQARGGCAPLETYLIGLRLAMWPVFQNQMNAHVDGLKKLADSAAGGLLTRGVVKDSTVQAVAQRFCAMFLSFVGLSTDEADEAMVFSHMLRLRQELIRLITTQSSKIKDPAQAASYQSTLYETILQLLTGAPVPTTHPRAQAEIAFWREREEEARRRVALTRR